MSGWVGGGAGYVPCMQGGTIAGLGLCGPTPPSKLDLRAGTLTVPPCNAQPGGGLPPLHRVLPAQAPLRLCKGPIGPRAHAVPPAPAPTSYAPAPLFRARPHRPNAHPAAPLLPAGPRAAQMRLLSAHIEAEEQVLCPALAQVRVPPAVRMRACARGEGRLPVSFESIGRSGEQLLPQSVQALGRTQRRGRGSGAWGEGPGWGAARGHQTALA